jgi:hypothetical protein
MASAWQDYRYIINFVSRDKLDDFSQKTQSLAFESIINKLMSDTIFSLEGANRKFEFVSHCFTPVEKGFMLSVLVHFKN